MADIRAIDKQEIAVVAATHRAHKAGLTWAEIDRLSEDRLLEEYGTPAHGSKHFSLGDATETALRHTKQTGEPQHIWQTDDGRYMVTSGQRPSGGRSCGYTCNKGTTT